MDQKKLITPSKPKKHGSNDLDKIMQCDIDFFFWEGYDFVFRSSSIGAHMKKL
jgi:hypothetical protein